MRRTIIIMILLIPLVIGQEKAIIIGDYPSKNSININIPEPVIEVSGDGSYNSTYATWAYNQTVGGGVGDGSYNSTYATWAYNYTLALNGNTFNITYNNTWNLNRSNNDMYFEGGIGRFIGIGNKVPKARLHITDGVLLINGSIGNVPVSGAGSRFMYVPSKKALRAGSVTGNGWDATRIGEGSAAFGDDAIAQQVGAFAAGYQVNATGFFSTVFNGYSVAQGDSSFAAGEGIISKSYGSYAIGLYNQGIGNSESYVQTDPLLEIGNGTSVTKRNNILTIFKNGYMTLGGNVSSYPLTVVSNVSGISIWVSSNISATGYITRSDVYDVKTQGAALNKFKNSTALLTLNNNINHSAFGYSYTSWNIPKIIGSNLVLKPRTVCYNFKINGTDKCLDDIVLVEEPIFKEVKEEGVDLVKEAALLRQAVYELKMKVEALEAKQAI